MSTISVPIEEAIIVCDSKECGCLSYIKELDIKMGGLLCPCCRKILFWPIDPVYKYELHRRRKDSP